MCYVGQKSLPPNKTKSYYGSGTIISRIIKKYGKSFLKKIILGEIFSNDLEDFKKQLDESETECIYFFRAYGADGINHDYIYGYNLYLVGGSPLGTKQSEERIQNRVIKNTGQKRNPQQCKNLSDGNKGVKRSEETCKRVSEARKGKDTWNKGKTDIYSDETIEQMRDSANKRYENPEERKNISDTLKSKYLEGYKNPRLGKKSTLEVNQKNSDWHKENGGGKNNPRYIDVDIDLILQLKRDGKSIKYISELLKVSEGIVKSRIKTPDKFR